MKRIVLLLALIPSLAYAGKSYDDAGSTIAHDCDKQGADVEFNGASSKITVTGKCKKISINGSMSTAKVAHAEKLTVTGSKNEVAVDHADNLSVSGASNTVSYKKAGKVSTTGVGNKVAKEKDAPKKD